MTPYSIGFSSQLNEYIIPETEIEGTLPSWLSGTLIRTAPARFEVGDNSYNHWFDGLCMLHKFSFQGDTVSYANKFLDSGTYRANMQKGRIVYGEFGTDPCRDLFQKATTFVMGFPVTDNAGVNVGEIGGELVSVTETPIPVKIDPETLEAEGQFKYEDKLGGQITPPHPHYSEDGTLFSFVTELGPTSYYHVYRQEKNSAERKVIASIKVKEPSYMHSLGMTENYVIVTAFPLVTQALKFRFTLKAFIEKYTWEPDRETIIYLIDKHTGEVKTYATEAFFAFHHVNAFEEDGKVIFDLLAYKNAQVIYDLYLEKLRSGDLEIVAGHLWRFELELSKGSVTRKVISESWMELPQINYGRVNGKPYQFMYSAGSTTPSAFLDVIHKADVTTGQVWTWIEEGCHPAEPIFIEKPGATAEDEGVLLSIVLDTRRQCSFLLVLDAQTLEEKARARVPHPINFGFHGTFLPN
ncbi:MAG TPA: beta-carotene 15,15'-monooxygenase [Cytophagales bacterium]|nr:beta-carotene 15,15'-monooxygenase [Cytophagales bacterium]HAA20255.1 beta-carotene 15,15'-monooxygenase [Cytophagales bacterium]HAP61789.1 beta-carotene 15,15'-monooxygenase [Cytophagales bacterium]